MKVLTEQMDGFPRPNIGDNQSARQGADGERMESPATRRLAVVPKHAVE
jgi:hypothetical protein